MAPEFPASGLDDQCVAHMGRARHTLRIVEQGFVRKQLLHTQRRVGPKRGRVSRFESVSAILGRAQPSSRSRVVKAARFIHFLLLWMNRGR